MDHLVSKESFDLIYDGNLDLLQTSPQPKRAALQKYYESEDYISHTDDKRGVFAWAYQFVKKWSVQHKTNLISTMNNGAGTLLDIGAGTGDFLLTAQKKGWVCFGVEPNLNALKLASGKGLSLKLNLNEFEGKQFDVVTLWHVLEHIPNLDEIVVHLTQLVKKNGTLIIAVPNYKSYDALYYGKFWAGFDVPRHLWHFSKHSMSALFSKSFRLVKIKPMFFDSFYVSLLSEKYMTGNKLSLKGIWIGLLSNFKARSSKEYSSHIYCFKKIE